MDQPTQDTNEMINKPSLHERAVRTLLEQINQRDQRIAILEEILASENNQRSENDKYLKALNDRVIQSELRVEELIREREQLSKSLRLLEDRMADKEQHTRSVIAKMAEKEKEAEYLQAALVEHQQGIQQMSDQLWEIYGSTAWKLVKLLWRVRLALLPHGSWTEKQVRRLFRRGGPAAVNPANEDLTASSDLVEAGDLAVNIAEEKLFTEEYKRMLAVATNQADEEYVGLSESDFSSVEAAVKLIAFYLPQFHPFPENDAWWGKGFTEWTNVSKAVPQFLGHYQPHLPGELGFYDLRVPEVQRRQVELAKQYGLHGFCFHYYWFNGKRLLERPLDQFIADPEIDFPFCLCWANENWTRRWDGLESEVLIEQVHSEESDYAFIHDLEPYLRHKNYIRVHGRPLLVVYRTQLIPDLFATAERWRSYCREVGIGELYLVTAQVGERVDPRLIGFDAAVEFPPNTMPLTEVSDTLDILNPDNGIRVFQYPELVDRMSAIPKPGYDLFKTVVPGWDNTPRRNERASIIALSSPLEYRRWLVEACRFALAGDDPEKRFVFINAWNEWAEGAHLEPDRRYGYAYLQATAEALKQLQPHNSFKPAGDR